jgi:hypothetical protein
MEALSNDRALVLQRIIRLAPHEATIVYWCMAIVCGLFVLSGLAMIVTGLVSKQVVRLTATELSAPRFAWSRTRTVVRLADIVEMTVQSVQKQRWLSIQHRGGKLTINESFLPSKAAFEELCKAIVSRKQTR